MGSAEILILISIILGILSYFILIRIRKYIFMLSSLLCLFLYSIFKDIYILSFIISFIIIIYIYYFYRLKKGSFSIRLIKACSESNEVKNFLATHKKDIYNIFPFYAYDKEQSFFLVYSENNIVGIFVYKISGDVLHVKVNYIRPIYRGFDIENYIYNKNPGYFKNLGINKIVSESFHKEYTRSLKRLGFKLETVENKQFYVKYFD